MSILDAESLAPGQPLRVLDAGKKRLSMGLAYAVRPGSSQVPDLLDAVAHDAVRDGEDGTLRDSRFDATVRR